MQTVTILPGHALQIHAVREPERVLLNRQWKALSEAEDRLYTDGAAYAHSYTGVTPQSESHLAALVWDRCEDHMDGELEGTEANSYMYDARIARRVARVMAVMAFGPEFILK